MYRMRLWLLKCINPIFFSVRNRLRLHPMPVKIEPFTYYPFFSEITGKREKELVTTFDFHPFVDKESYAMNLYILDLMHSSISFPSISEVKAIDVGSKNFNYAAALHAFYSSVGSLKQLTGIEIDAYRRYDDLTTRADHAQVYILPLPHTTYLAMDFLAYNKPTNVITMFLPFVFEDPLLYWGLPLRMYQPKKLFAHAYSLLETGGIWIITNQGREEEVACHAILQELGIHYEPKGAFESPFYPYKTRFTTVVYK